MATYDEALAAVNEARAHQASTAAAVSAASSAVRRVMRDVMRVCSLCAARLAGRLDCHAA